MKHYSAFKKNKVWPFAVTWMDLEGIMLSKLSSTEKEKNYDITYKWNQKSTTNYLI